MHVSPPTHHLSLQGRDINLICISGGPITTLERSEMSAIIDQVEAELTSMQPHTRIRVEYLTYAKFCQMMADSHNTAANTNLPAHE